jgi:soluble lytic murein transglycosylase-like protein
MRMRAESAGEGGRERAWTGLLLGILIGWELLGQSAALGEVYSYKDRRGVVHFTNAPSDGRFREVEQTSARLTRLSFTATHRSAVRRSGRSSYFAARSPFRGVFSPRSEASPELASMIDETSRRYGVDSALVHAVVRAESAFDHLAVSSAGARGLMQLMPTTASEVGVRDVFHPRDNLEGGVYYLRELLDRFSGNTRLALAAYNAGPGAVDSYGGIPPYDETREYVSRVFRYRQEHLRRQLEARVLKKAVGTSR